MHFKTTSNAYRKMIVIFIIVKKMYRTSQIADTKNSWIMVIQHLQILLQKGNGKEAFYGLTHFILRQSKQKFSFCCS